jgi:diacylglycerol kinase family enzyme
MKPRGVLVANPNATTTSPWVRDIITRALAHEVDLEVVTTTHRGHAQELAATTSDIDLLVTLGGDGTINEVVNGLLSSGRADLPMLATIPGGSANVMARALGFPNDAIEAAGMILESLRTDSSHTIGLGNAQFLLEGSAQRHSHWFTINAGVGLDADVVAAMEAQRAEGHAASPGRYVRTAVRQYLSTPHRAHGTLTLQVPGGEPVTGIALVIVQNTAPWTYFGPVPINPCPDASFDLGLDVFAPHSLGVFATTRYGLRMLRGSHAGAVEGRLTLLHDQGEVRLSAESPASLQVDGDHLGQVSEVVFRAAPKALTIVG